ncbi:hypothetical protein EYC98_18190 [Halieaceae bacterium IMCC14734]|uniref:Uncharacterized protein n=1 Tax=Candidatus Litorirhabdus singularis TaxID=2518993 RepID=A0ABT3TKE6_9GAMM|nr:hypothetical protein [Candidatus Litorirhabdus singularis]
MAAKTRVLRHAGSGGSTQKIVENAQTNFTDLSRGRFYAGRIVLVNIVVLQLFKRRQRVGLCQRCMPPAANGRADQIEGLVAAL